MEEYSVDFEDIHGYKEVSPLTTQVYLTSGFYSQAMGEDYHPWKIYKVGDPQVCSQAVRLLTPEEEEERDRNHADYIAQIRARQAEEERIENMTCAQRIGASIISLFKRG